MKNLLKGVKEARGARSAEEPQVVATFALSIGGYYFLGCSLNHLRPRYAAPLRVAVTSFDSRDRPRGAHVACSTQCPRREQSASPIGVPSSERRRQGPLPLIALAVIAFTRPGPRFGGVRIDWQCWFSRSLARKTTPAALPRCSFPRGARARARCVTRHMPELRGPSLAVFPKRSQGLRSCAGILSIADFRFAPIRWRCGGLVRRLSKSRAGRRDVTQGRYSLAARPFAPYATVSLVLSARLGRGLGQRVWSAMPP